MKEVKQVRSYRITETAYKNLKDIFEANNLKMQEAIEKALILYAKKLSKNTIKGDKQNEKN